MRFFYFIFLGVLFACEADPEASAENEDHSTEPVVMEDPNHQTEFSIDRAQYIDERIAGTVKLDAANPTEKKDQVYALIQGDRFLVKKYQGTLMKASGTQGGFSLKLDPYSFWDDVTGQMINSPYAESINIYLSKENNDVLGYVDYSDATENLAWDFFENLFTIYYYTDGEKNCPLKFINEGKTEWDG